MTRKSYIPSIKYAVRSIYRNKRRSLTLMFGIIISIAIISGVLFYLDSTTDTLVGKAFENVDIDTAISAGLSANETEMQEILEFAINESSIEGNNLDLILGAELIVGTDPFGVGWRGSNQGFKVGAIVSPNSENNLTMESLAEIMSDEGNLSVTYIIGIEPSYLETFSLFSTAADIVAIFENNQVLVSSDLESDLMDNDNLIEVTLASLSFSGDDLQLHILMNETLEVGGTIEFDSNLMQKSIAAFNPDQVEEDIGQSAQISNFILMSYKQYWSLFVNQTTMHSAFAIDFNMVHLKLDHTALSIDTDVIHGQLNQIKSTFEVFFPDVIVVDLLGITLDQIDDQLNQMRLFLVYFALPGLLIGAYVSKYAIDLTLKERQKEIGLLRTKTVLRSQIAVSMGFESFLISTIGMGVGLATGYFASFFISNSLNGGGLIAISLTSMLISTVIGLVIVGIATYFSTKQLLSPTVTQTLKANSEQKPALWRRIYLDYIFLGITLVTIVLQYLDFNPTTGFAASLYNFVAPFLAWIGLTLLLIRGLTKILQKLRNPLIKVYRLLFKDLSTIISKNIFYRLEKISKITILLSLTISFGLVVSVINATYEVGAQQDAAYQVGADIRVMFPNTGYLDYNTSDFIASLEGNFTQEIYDTTSLYKSGIQLGRSGLLLIGIEPETFFDVANIEDNYLYTESLEGTKMALLDNSSGLYNNIIFSETLTNPTYAQDSSRESRRGGLNEDADSSTQVFMIGESYPIQAEGAVSEITVADIAYHFPAIADVTGKSDDELIYAITNVEFLKSPVADSNVNLLADENAVLSLIKINEGYSSEEVIDNIYTWYAENYPSSSDISLISVEDKLEEYLPLMSSLTGLTTMEFILVLAVSSLGLEIFIVSSLYDRKKEFGTYYAIGASKRDVRGIVFGELLLITGFSLVSGLLLGGLISFMYLTFISSLLVLSVSSLVIPMVSVVILIVLVVLATLLAIGLSSGKLAKLDPVNILRTV